MYAQLSAAGMEAGSQTNPATNTISSCYRVITFELRQHPGAETRLENDTLIYV